MKKFFVCLILFVFVMSAVACGGETRTEVAFKQGAPTEFAITNSLVVENYVETDLYEAYTLTITDSSGKESKIEGATWRPSAPGEYKLKLTVGGQSSELKITVTAPTMTWVYQNASPVYNKGATIDFDEYISFFNIVVTAYNNDYKLYVDRILVDAQTVDVSERESYTISSDSIHTVIIKAESSDGQTLEMNTTLTVRETNAATLAWMENNNITISGNYLAIKEDNTFKLGAGSYVGNLWDGVSDVNVPYVAINGNYGLEKAVTVSFTGKNAPDIAFFVGDEAKDPFGGTWAAQNAKGLLANNGLFTNSGAEDNPNATSQRITISGPNMFGKGLNFNRKWHLVKTPAAYSYLIDDHEYQYTIYYTQTDSIDSEGNPVDASATHIKLVVILRDVTEGTVVFDNRNTNTTLSQVTQSDSEGKNLFGVFNTASFAESDYFGGNILIYGRFGNTTEFKIERLPFDASSIE